jgi:hypothetical protein
MGWVINAVPLVTLPWEWAGMHSTGGWVVPGPVWLGAKNLILPGFDPQISQPIQNHCANCYLSQQKLDVSNMSSCAFWSIYVAFLVASIPQKYTFILWCIHVIIVAIEIQQCIPFILLLTYVYSQQYKTVIFFTEMQKWVCIVFKLQNNLYCSQLYKNT